MPYPTLFIKHILFKKSRPKIQHKTDAPEFSINNYSKTHLNYFFTIVCQIVNMTYLQTLALSEKRTSTEQEKRTSTEQEQQRTCHIMSNKHKIFKSNTCFNIINKLDRHDLLPRWFNHLLIHARQFVQHSFKERPSGKNNAGLCAWQS